MGGCISRGRTLSYMQKVVIKILSTTTRSTSPLYTRLQSGILTSILMHSKVIADQASVVARISAAGS